MMVSFRLVSSRLSGRQYAFCISVQGMRYIHTSCSWVSKTCLCVGGGVVSHSDRAVYAGTVPT